MQIVVRSVGDVTVLDLKGKMTLGEGEDLLKDEIGALLARGERRVILNLESVPYIDSSGMNEVVRSYTRVSGRLKLLNPNKRIRDLLVFNKLSTVLDVFESEGEALASFRKKAAQSP